MPAAPLPATETQRLARLRASGLLDSPRDAAFDDLVQIAAALAGTPIAAISLVDQGRQWFKAKVGLEVDETPRSMAFCAHAILDPLRPLVVSDAAADLRFADNPLVTGAPGIRTYIGIPLGDGDSALPYGTLCVIDRRVRTLGEAQIAALAALARRAEGLFAERRLHRELERERRELAASEARYRGVIAALDEGVVVQDARGTIIAVNQAAERILGLPAAAMLGRNCADPAWDAIDAEGRPLPSREHPPSVTLRTGMPQRARILGFAKPGGGTLWITSNSHPLELPSADGGSERGVVASFSDISERRQAEEELRATRDAALASARAKSSFLANVSHEIRTPLNGVLGMASLLLDGPLDEQQRELAAAIQSSGSTLLTLVNDLLDLAKIEAGALRLERIPYAPALAVAEAAEVLRTRAADKGLALDVICDPEVPEAVLGDPTRLRQVLINLIGNAVKFTDRGRVEVAVTCVPAGPEALWLEVAVEDTGIGFDASVAERLFRPFSQGDLSTTRRFGGTGLGLAICRELCQLMGGDIGCTSQPGVGSCFRLRVRVGRVAPTEPAPRPAPARPAVRLRGRVLIAEDNAINLRITTAFCQRLGLETDCVGTGAAALRALERGGYDLVLMDCQMPDMDGYDATLAWRQRETGPRIPILALTAHAMPEHRQRCLDCGMDAHLAKPIQDHVLLAALRAWLPLAG